MKTIIRHLIIVFILLLGSAATLTLQAKTVYPIQLTAQLLPPYSNCLGDYMSGSMDRVNVMAVMKDVSFEAGNQPKSYKIQLRMVVRQGNRVVLESKTKLGNAMTFDLLRDGLVKRLEGAGRLLDPAYSIINAPGYSNNGYCVNEGSYDIVFQAFDARNPQMALSEPYSFHVYLNESEPVSLMSPIHNTCVGMNTGAITFMWMERTVPLIAQNKKYHFEIREVQEGAVSMENAAETGNIVHSEELNSSVTMRVVPITAGKFKVGRTYVWRIQIVGQDTKVKNNGWSEVGVFRYDRCMDKIDVVKVEGVCNDLKKPEIVKAETLKEPQGTISWVLNDDAAKVQEIDSFRVEYTLASDQVGFWTRVPVSRTSAQAGTVDDKTFEDELTAKYKGKTYYTHQLANLDKGKEYVVRISSIKCSTDKDGNVVADCHSVADSVKFTLPLMEAGQAGQCRMEVPELTCKEDVDPNHKPNKGDYIYANGANVKILDIAPSKTEGGHTYYSGTGITSLPFLEGVVGLYMRFDDIRISCDNELLEGKIVTVYDENNSFSLDLNGLLNDNYMGTGPTPQQESIQPVRSKEQVEDGTVGIVTDGEDEGAVYAKSPEGGSAPVKVGEKFSCDEVAESDIDDEYGTFTFTPLEGDNTPYDLNAGKFDKPTIMKYYEKFGTYDVPWFAVVQGKTSTIKATFKPNAEGKEVDLDRISFICKTKKDAIKLEAKKTGDYTYTLTIFGDVPDQSLCIYAVYMEKNGKAVSQDLENDDAAQDDACKTLVTLGKAKIASMKYRKKKLIMIPVGNNITINTDNIQQTLDAVYAPLGVKYTVTQEPAFVDEQVNSILSEGLDVTDHSIFKDESQNMRLLQQLYKGTHEESIDVDATYLFVLPKVAGMESVKGIMPLNRSVGYVFVGENGGEYADGVTVAHELGHGMFSFQHSFDYGSKEGETDNLMDYSNPEGTHLAVWQWNLISTHKTYTIPFLTTDKDAMFYDIYESSNSIIIPSLKNDLSEYIDEYHGDEYFNKADLRYRNKNDYVAFVDPSGLSIFVPIDATNLFFENGFLKRFTDGKNQTWYSRMEDSKYIGFFKEVPNYAYTNEYNWEIFSFDTYRHSLKNVYYIEKVNACTYKLQKRKYDAEGYKEAEKRNRKKMELAKSFPFKEQVGNEVVKSLCDIKLLNEVKDGTNIFRDEIISCLYDFQDDGQLITFKNTQNKPVLIPTSANYYRFDHDGRLTGFNIEDKWYNAFFYNEKFLGYYSNQPRKFNADFECDYVHSKYNNYNDLIRKSKIVFSVIGNQLFKEEVSGIRDENGILKEEPFIVPHSEHLNEGKIVVHKPTLVDCDFNGMPDEYKHIFNYYISNYKEYFNGIFEGKMTRKQRLYEMFLRCYNNSTLIVTNIPQMGNKIKLQIGEKYFLSLKLTDSGKIFFENWNNSYDDPDCLFCVLYDPDGKIFKKYCSLANATVYMNCIQNLYQYGLTNFSQIVNECCDEMIEKLDFDAKSYIITEILKYAVPEAAEKAILKIIKNITVEEADAFKEFLLNKKKYDGNTVISVLMDKVNGENLKTLMALISVKMMPLYKKEKFEQFPNLYDLTIAIPPYEHSFYEMYKSKFSNMIISDLAAKIKFKFEIIKNGDGFKIIQTWQDYKVSNIYTNNIGNYDIINNAEYPVGEKNIRQVSEKLGPLDPVAVWVYGNESSDCIDLYSLFDETKLLSNNIENYIIVPAIFLQYYKDLNNFEERKQFILTFAEICVDIWSIYSGPAGWGVLLKDIRTAYKTSNYFEFMKSSLTLCSEFMGVVSSTNDLIIKGTKANDFVSMLNCYLSIMGNLNLSLKDLHSKKDFFASLAPKLFSIFDGIYSKNKTLVDKDITNKLHSEFEKLGFYDKSAKKILQDINDNKINIDK